MVEKCCETCENDMDECTNGTWCQHSKYYTFDEYEKYPHDGWVEGEKKRHLQYRIAKLESIVEQLVEANTRGRKLILKKRE